MYPKNSKRHKTEVIHVTFDPSLKYDKKSGVVKKQLRIDHMDHPHFELVDVTANFHFPNIKFE